ncbi:MAG: hypothetical protein NTY51_08685 [Deltaproteobacteria bacterium]|nr:hypothetical protein [Deltaproteobacteria bacterium]
METKTVDSRGRINLGKEFANKTCFFEKIGETEIRLELAAVIPERELWLYKNLEAKALLEIGLEQAKAKQFSASPPGLDADQALVDQLED